MCQDFSKMPNSAQAGKDFIWPIKMNTTGSPQFIHLLSKQTKFHLILSETLAGLNQLPWYQLEKNATILIVLKEFKTTMLYFLATLNLTKIALANTSINFWVWIKNCTNFFLCSQHQFFLQGTLKKKYIRTSVMKRELNYKGTIFFQYLR